MATVITELGTVSGKRENILVYNITVTDASEGIDILAADPEYRYGIRSIDMCGQFAGTEWFKIFNGEDILIGPRILATGIPWVRRFDDLIYCNKGNALRLQTKSAVNLNLIIEVVSGEPYPSSSPSASPSA
jgi:hypothetical protein